MATPKTSFADGRTNWLSSPSLSTFFLPNQAPQYFTLELHVSLKSPFLEDHSQATPFFLVFSTLVEEKQEQSRNMTKVTPNEHATEN
jgi:hypothetical protein